MQTVHIPTHVAEEQLYLPMISKIEITLPSVIYFDILVWNLLLDTSISDSIGPWCASDFYPMSTKQYSLVAMLTTANVYGKQPVLSLMV